MTTLLEAAKGYVNELNAKNIDGALSYLQDDAVMHTPMGPQNGKGDIKKMLKMMSQMGGEMTTPDPELRDGDVVADIDTPMGPGKLVFEGEEQISAIRVAIG